MLDEYPVVPLGKLSRNLEGVVFGELTALYKTNDKVQPNG